MESVVPEIDIFVSSTGHFSMKKLTNNALFGNTGHLDNEIGWAGSERLEGVKVATASLNDHFVFPIVHGVIVLASKLQERATCCRRRNCTFLHWCGGHCPYSGTTVSTGVKVEGPHKRGHYVLMLCSFTNQVLAQLDLLRY